MDGDNDGECSYRVSEDSLLIGHIQNIEAILL